MRDLGVLWQRCQSGQITEWEYQRYLLIDSVQYFDNEIIDLSWDRGLTYDNFSVGNAISAKLTCIFIPKPMHIISDNAPVKLFLRIATADDGMTDWHEFGTFYVHLRTQEFDKLKLDCYDAIRYLETPYLDGTETVNWPIPCTEAMVPILRHLGMELDPRTQLNPAFFAEEPEGMSMREALRHIGSMHAGNWHITEENRLRLVQPVNAPPVYGITRGSLKRITSSNPERVGKVIIERRHDDEGTFEAGDGDDAMRLWNPWGTQPISDYVYSVLSVYRYNTFDLQSVEIDPAVELGDPIDVEGVDANLWQVAYSLRVYANIIIPPDSEIREVDEFGGGFGPPGGGRTVMPHLVWDFNEQPITVEQTETEIAAIDVDVTVAGNAQGHFQLTFMSDRAAEVHVRIYDNGNQQLYSPTVFQAKKGFNQLGIPHSYIRLRRGLHLFTVTMQTRAGWINIGTRALKYSIDLFAADVEPITHDIRDVAIRQPVFALEPTDVYAIAMSRDEEIEDGEPAAAHSYPIVIRARYLAGQRYTGRDFNAHWAFPAIEAKELAIEFDGVYQRLAGQEKSALVTKDKPEIFWTDGDDVLWTQYGDEAHTRRQIAQDVLSVSVCRGWNALDFPDYDLGLIAAYIKRGGTVAYRVYINTPSTPGAWMPEEEIEEAGDGNSYVHVHRLNDYRIGFAVTGINKEFVSEKYLAGQGLKPEHNALAISTISNFWTKPDEYPALALTDIEFIDNFNVIITGNYPFALRSGRNTHANNLSVSQGGNRAISGLWVEDGKLRLELANPVSPYADITLTAHELTFLQYDIGGIKPYWPSTGLVIPGTPLGIAERNAVSIRAEASFTLEEIVRSTHEQAERNALSIRAEAAYIQERVNYPTHNQPGEHNALSIRAEAIFRLTPIGVDPL